MDATSGLVLVMFTAMSLWLVTVTEFTSLSDDCGATTFRPRQPTWAVSPTVQQSLSPSSVTQPQADIHCNIQCRMEADLTWELQ